MIGVALLAWLVVGVIDDLQLGRRGVVVTATVEDIRGNDRFHDCLASVAIDGVAYRQWAHAMPDAASATPIYPRRNSAFCLRNALFSATKRAFSAASRPMRRESSCRPGNP